MRYGMTFLVDFYDFDNDRGEQLLTRPGDYIQMQLWVENNMKPKPGEDSNMRDLRVNFAVTWFALKREGRLGEFGIPEELSVDAINEMANRFSVFVDTPKEDSLPLAKGRGK